HLGISDSRTGTNQPQHSLSSCLGSSLCVSRFPHSGRRGLGAARDLGRGEIVLRSVMEDEKLCDAVNRHSSLSPAQTSRWHPYLVHMPQTYDILAMFGEFEKRALQVDEAMWVTEKAMLKAKSEWKEAHALMEDLMFKPQFLTFKAWVWAAATISSQTMHIPWDEAGCLCLISSQTMHIPWDEAGCLCLVGDLFNYDAPGMEPSGIEDLEHFLSNSSIHDTSLLNGDNNIMRLTDGWFEEDVNAYCFYSRAHYKKGDQVLLCYGIYTNLELVEHYGFLLQENPNDKVFIPLEPAVYSSTSWSKESLYVHHNGKPSYALLAALRLWATPQNKRRSVGHLVHSGSQLSADNEIFIMKWLSKTCDAVLKNLPTSIEEDTLLLNAMDNSQDFSTFIEITKLMSSRDEIHTCLEAHKMKDAHSFNDVILCRKARRSMDKWKLAVQWRLKYKEVLFDCISY
ncbi:Protein SET DOMAIN GROUP 40, partial [Glycine soja]